MMPELARLGPFALHGYGAMVGLGLIVSWFVLAKEARRKGLDRLANELLSLYGWMLLAGFVGGKAFYIATSYGEFREVLDRSGFGRAMSQGFVFYGSLLTCIPTLAVWLKRRAIPFLPALDAAILAAPIMLGLGRVGCFLAGCCYGHRTVVPWGAEYPQAHVLHDQIVHPAPLYETLGCAVILAVLWFGVRPRARFDGQVVAAYLVLYGVERVIVEFFRGDAARGFLFGGAGLLPGDPSSGLATSQAISLPLIVFGAVWLRLGLRRRAALEGASRAERRRAR